MALLATVSCRVCMRCERNLLL